MAILYWEPVTSAAKPEHGRHVLLWLDDGAEQDFCVGYWDEHSQERPCFRCEAFDQALDSVTHWRYAEGPNGETPTHYSATDEQPADA